MGVKEDMRQVRNSISELRDGMETFKEQVASDMQQLVDMFNHHPPYGR